MQNMPWQHHMYQKQAITCLQDIIMCLTMQSVMSVCEYAMADALGGHM